MISYSDLARAVLGLCSAFPRYHRILRDRLLKGGTLVTRLRAGRCPKKWDTNSWMVYNGHKKRKDDLGTPILGNPWKPSYISAIQERMVWKPSWVLHARFVSCLSYSWQHWCTVLLQESPVAFLFVEWLKVRLLISMFDRLPTSGCPISMIWSLPYTSIYIHSYPFIIFPLEYLNPHFYLRLPRCQLVRRRSHSLCGSCSEGTW